MALKHWTNIPYLTEDVSSLTERARAQGWRDLALVHHPDPLATTRYVNAFRLRTPLGPDAARAVASLPALAALDLSSNEIRDEGAHHIMGLKGLVSLELPYNKIGVEGIHALTKLPRLASLNLNGNNVGPKGAWTLSTQKSLSALQLTSCGIGPESVRAIAKLSRLVSLDLSNNYLGDDSSSSLVDLASLTDLKLRFTQTGPDGARRLAAITSLASLDLSGNHLSDEGARQLLTLVELTALDLSRNQIEDDGAEALASLAGLRSLHLSNNDIGDRGARALAALRGLTYLDLSANHIGDAGARAISALGGLAVLNLSTNQVGDDGAKALARLTSLEALGLRGNHFGDDAAHALLGAFATGRSRITHLDLTDNRVSVLPPEVFAGFDAQAMLAAYRRYRRAEARDALRPLNEAKVLVVGNEAVGKTSLIRYLIRGEARREDEQKTPGTELHEQIEVNHWTADPSGLKLNVWDFGGQEVMRGTHRFFLTERSLYLLVLDNRREDDRSIYEWLELISQRAGTSPVIVVINKSDHVRQRLQIDDAVLQRYPIVGVVRTSCNPGRVAAASIEKLRAKIVETLQTSPRLQHVRDPIPEAWLRVKSAIAAMARERSVLPVRDFVQLCLRPVGLDTSASLRATGDVTEDLITDPAEQQLLLSLLHDLGIVVAHGLRRDAVAAAREVTVLDPNWLTGAIYALINSPAVRDKQGIFTRADMAKLLPEARYPPQWHELILAMMQEPALGLCFPLPGGQERFLIPEALPKSAPDFAMWPEDSLRFRYRYRVLPTDLLPRFIVEANHDLSDPPTRWRQGAVLGIEGCRILVRGDLVRNQIDVLVAGDGTRRSALDGVRWRFKAVHDHYANPGFEERVPLPDQPELDVGYEHLRRLEKTKGQDYAYPADGAEREYTVRELLEGVRPQSSSARERTHEAMRTSMPSEEARPILAPPRIESHRGRVDVGIITIREDENDAVLRRFEKVETVEGRRRYRIRRLPLPNGSSYTLAVLRCGDQGTANAQAAAHALLEELEPRFVLVVGIAGGIPSDERSLGDVVVSTRIVDFSVEVVIQDQGREYALAGGPLDPAAEKLATDIGAMVSDHELRDWTRGEYRDWNDPAVLGVPRPTLDLGDDRFYGKASWIRATRSALQRRFAGAAPPRATSGAIASSDRLIKDTETLGIWLKLARQVVAIEMESAGIYRATQERRVPFLAIRGLSDVVGFKRTGEWTTFACETAAAFTRAFLLTCPITPIDRTGQSFAAPQQPVAVHVAEQHRILFLSASPSSEHALALAAEERAIREELQRSPARAAFSFQTCPAAQPLDLLRALREVRPTVIHFSGHGHQAGLHFQGADGAIKLVNGDALARALSAAGSSVRLVVLNACYSDEQAQLLRAHVDCVIGMTGALQDSAAQAFAVGLHGGLAAGESIAVAFAQGCAAVALDDLALDDRPRLLVRDGINAASVVLVPASVAPL